MTKAFSAIFADRKLTERSVCIREPREAKREFPRPWVSNARCVWNATRASLPHSRPNHAPDEPAY